MSGDRIGQGERRQSGRKRAKHGKQPEYCL